MKSEARKEIDRQFSILKRLAFPEYLERQRQTRAANPEKERALNKKRWAENKETEYARTRAWFKVHPEKQKEYNRRKAERHPDRKRLSARKDYIKHRPRYIERALIWSRNNPDKKSDYEHSRRAQKLSTGSENCFKKIELLKQDRFCHWCCWPLTLTNFTIDHIIPLKRGGRHIPDNLVASCKSCNCSKNDKLIEEWDWATCKEAA